MTRVSFIGLGCSKNTTDLEYLIGYLSNNGLKIENELSKSDYIIINTCGFVEEAVTESVETIIETGQAKSEGTKIIAAGCMVERYRDEFGKEFPEVDFFTGVHTLQKAADFIIKDSKLSLDSLKEYGEERIISNIPYYAYVKIADGCNNNCSYCTIPSIRGGLQSRFMEDIVAEIEKLLENGVKEIILISQDCTKYGCDIYEKSAFVDLLEEIDNIDSEFYLRILYLNPDGLSEDTIKRMTKLSSLIPYFEIPVQHISDSVLSMMNRHSDSSHIRDIYTIIRRELPDAFIRTTFILGFPGETISDYLKVKEFLEEYKPDYAGFFKFSPEEGTEAFDFPGRVNDEIADKRIEELQSIQERNTVSKLNEIKKSNIVVFADKPNEDFDFILEGRAMFQAPEIDGKAYIIDGVASNGHGPYKCSIEKIIYPDIYCKIL